jgi:hypothetical protein
MYKMGNMYKVVKKINRKYGSISLKIDKNEKWYKSVHIVGLFYYRVYNFSLLIV